jgi:hypothetical protein
MDWGGKNHEKPSDDNQSPIWDQTLFFHKYSLVCYHHSNLLNADPERIFIGPQMKKCE